MMPAGVVGFVKERLTLAREACGMRQHELALIVKKSPATVSKWESGGQKPEPLMINTLCEALDVFPNWFFKPLDRGMPTIFFRSLVSELEMLRNKAKARLCYVEAIEEFISEFVDLPEIDIPDLMKDFDFRDLRDHDIEEIALELRAYWEIDNGPIKDLMLLIENAGVVVGEDKIGSVKLDGLSCWSKRSGRPYMLLAKDKMSGSRRRYDAAHELSHLVLHKYVTQKDLEENFQLVETQAMQLAGAFLMPGQEFKRSIYSISLESLAEQKRIWGVSVGAMIKRLANLSEISVEVERRLWQYYSKRKWRSGEPNENYVKMETPENIRHAIKMLVNDGSFTKLALLKEVGLSSEDICCLSGLEKSFFADESRAVLRNLPKIKLEDDLFDDTNIIRFPVARK